MARLSTLAALPTVLFAGICLLVAPDHVPAEPEKKQPSPRAIYDSDPDHLWNRLHAALLVRTGPDGKEYGHDRLEPILWHESDYLLKGKPAEQAVAVLEEFLRTRGETLLDDPLKRALLQRDLWLVANWLSESNKPEDPARKRLAVPLAKVLRRLALTPEQIASLPDNYAAAVASKTFPGKFDPDKLEQAYLPPDLFQPDGPWVCVGRTDGRTAPLHLQSNANNPFSNSTFFVFLNLPAGREASLAFLKQLTGLKKPLFLREPRAPFANPEVPQLPIGTQLALVRRALLIDTEGRLVASSLTESVQLRVYRVAVVPKNVRDLDVPIEQARQRQAAFEIRLQRSALFAKEAGGLHDASAQRDFKTGFASHAWDEFQRERGSEPFPQRAQPFPTIRHACYACHGSATVYGTMSFQRYSPADEVLDDRSPPLFPVAAQTVAEVERAAIKWKEQQPTWLALRKLFPE
jgi:hypothetical protein